MKTKERNIGIEQQKDTTTSRRGKHLNYNERIVIEKLLKAGLSKTQVARELERSYSTIRREVANGTVEHLNSDLTTSMVYNADRTQDVHDLNASAKGVPVKLLVGRSAVLFISYFIRVKRWSPEAVAARMKEKGMPDTLCAKSIYNYIDQGWIPGVSNETLWEKRKRTQLYYAHPYASWERGSNENGNRMIRRFIPKGADIADYSREKIREIQNWINGYPRELFQFKTAEEMFNLELAI